MIDVRQVAIVAGVVVVALSLLTAMALKGLIPATVVMGAATSTISAFVGWLIPAPKVPVPQQKEQQSNDLRP